MSSPLVTLHNATCGYGARDILTDVDLDPQGNTSSGLGIEKGKLDACIYDVIINGDPITDIIIPDVVEGVAI